MKSRILFSFLLTILLISGLTACGTSKTKAEDIALSHAGLTAEEVTGLHTEFDNNDGLPMYEVSFYFNDTEYEYDIDAKSGAILTADKDIY